MLNKIAGMLRTRSSILRNSANHTTTATTTTSNTNNTNTNATTTTANPNANANTNTNTNANANASTNTTTAPANGIVLAKPKSSGIQKQQTVITQSSVDRLIEEAKLLYRRTNKRIEYLSVIIIYSSIYYLLLCLCMIPILQ